MTSDERSRTSGDQQGDKLGATRVQIESELRRTPDDIMRRYRENRNWKLYQKEWIYKNLLAKDMDVLDFGCGTGEITTQAAMLGAKTVYSVDVTPELLDITKERARLDGVSERVETICGYIQNLAPRPVDLVIAFAVLHHCHPISSLLPSLLQWLRPGGTFVCVEPVVYFGNLEKVRVASGVPFEPLDEGERKLDSRDVECITDCLDNPRREHFRLVGRLDRWLPDRPLRHIDHLLFHLPGMSKLAGSVLIHGQKKQ